MFLFSVYDTFYNSYSRAKTITDAHLNHGNLKENYNRPLMVEDFMNYNRILNGLFMQPTQKVDMLFTQTVSF